MEDLLIAFPKFENLKDLGLTLRWMILFTSNEIKCFLCLRIENSIKTYQSRRTGLFANLRSKPNTFL